MNTLRDAGVHPLPIVLAAMAVALPIVGATLDPAGAAERVDAVTTSGSGTLTICRNWLVYDSCGTYHNVAVPPQIAVGDRFVLTFGSNPKDYVFHVARVALQGDACTILAEDNGGTIEIAHCRATAKPAADAR